MANNVLVIVGAGASYDCVNVEEPHPATIKVENRPPLTDQLFSQQAICAETIPKYRAIEDLVPEVLQAIRSGGALEAILRKVAESDKPHRKWQVFNLPLYLMDVFWKVSLAYTTAPVNFTALIGQLFDAFDRVAFLSLNYDLLLEQALSRHYSGGPFTQIDSYTRDSWILIKLHGSVNWGRRIVSLKPSEYPLQHMPDENAYRRIFNQWPLEMEVEDTISLVPSQTRFWGSSEGMFYPDLCIPVEGKYPDICPPRHKKALMEFLPSCDTVLVIGASGKDKDLIDILSERLPEVRSFYVVGFGQDTIDSLTRFMHEVPQIGGGSYCDEGFTGFLRAGGLALVR